MLIPNKSGKSSTRTLLYTSLDFPFTHVSCLRDWSRSCQFLSNDLVSGYLNTEFGSYCSQYECNTISKEDINTYLNNYSHSDYFERRIFISQVHNLLYIHVLSFINCFIICYKKYIYVVNLYECIYN